MALTGEQYQSLVRTLLISFPNEDALRQLVKYQLNQNLAEIAIGANLHDVVFNLVGWADATGNVIALFRGARRLNPENQELKAIQKDFDPQSSTEDLVIEALKLFGLQKWTEAIAILHDALRLNDSFPASTESLILYNLCCAESRLAQACGDDTRRKQLLDNALKSLERWLEQGTKVGWAALGRSPENRMDFLSHDDDVFFLLQQRKAGVRKLVARYVSIPLTIPKHPSGLSGSCVPAGTRIDTPIGVCRVEEVGKGATISSLDIENSRILISSSVTRIRTSRTARCVHLNRAFVSSLSQPIYERSGGWMPAGQIKVGMEILTGTGEFESVKSYAEVEGYFEIYVLSTDHPSHNYIANGFVCHNEKP